MIRRGVSPFFIFLLRCFFSAILAKLPDLDFLRTVVEGFEYRGKQAVQLFVLFYGILLGFSRVRPSFSPCFLPPLVCVQVGCFLCAQPWFVAWRTSSSLIGRPEKRSTMPIVFCIGIFMCHAGQFSSRILVTWANRSLPFRSFFYQWLRFTFS